MLKIRFIFIDSNRRNKKGFGDNKQLCTYYHPNASLSQSKIDIKLSFKQGNCQLWSAASYDHFIEISTVLPYLESYIYAKSSLFN